MILVKILHVDQNIPMIQIHTLESDSDENSQIGPVGKTGEG